LKREEYRAEFIIDAEIEKLQEYYGHTLDNPAYPLAVGE
jgi:hypothetical protein